MTSLRSEGTRHDLNIFTLIKAAFEAKTQADYAIIR